MRESIEKKHSKSIEFLLASLRRAIIEEEIHIKQKDKASYKRLDLKYGQDDDWDMRKFLKI